MKIVRTSLTAIAIALSAGSFATAKPPKQVPPSVTVKDLALREARACDANRNGRIDASEMTSLRMAQSKNPKSYLYLFDANENKYLDDSELSKLRFAPGGNKKKK